MRRLAVLLSSWMIMTGTMSAAARSADRMEYAIAVHGGAGPSPKEITPAEHEAIKKSLAAALTIGRNVLAEGGTSLDAVERVIRVMEDEPLFNAGKGAVYNDAGGHELDASIMDGRNKACGAVAGVRTVKNPISLARLVMTETRHVLLLGDGAERFATEMKVERVDPKYFDTDRAFQRWQKAKKEALEKEQRLKKASTLFPRSTLESERVPGEHRGTVGCVALDKHGNLAAGTSTGGLTNKKYGRVGDSPIVGAGTYADNATCAVSCTGTGEQFIRHAISYSISSRIALVGESVGDAVRHAVRKTLDPDDGGIIAVGKNGEIAMEFSTEGMARGAADSTGRFEVHLAPQE